MRVRIYKRIFDKSVWVSEPEVEERSRAVLNTERPSFGEADIFPVGLTCLSAQCGARILKERKERITVLLLSADRRNGSPLPSIPFVHSIPFHSIPPFPWFIQCICLQMHFQIKRSRIVRKNTISVRVASKCRYMPIVMCWNHWSKFLSLKFLAFAIIRKLNKCTQIMKQDSL